MRARPASSRLGSVATSSIIAALLIGISAAAACWAVEHAALASVRSNRLESVRNTLRDARSLVVARERNAARTATRFAARADVQAAFVRHDAAPLLALAQQHPGLAFQLWDGRTLGESSLVGPTSAVAVYSAGSLAGRVLVAARPDGVLLQRARDGSPGTKLFVTVAGSIAAASPPVGGRSATELLQQSVSDGVALGSTPRGPTELYGYRAAPHIWLAWLWPFLVGLAAFAGSLRFFEGRDARRRAEPPPNTVRDAVALVGETLAATHNPQALLPVILQAAVEATDASGGTITSGSTTLATRGAVASSEAEALEVTLEVSEGQTAIMTLFPSGSGFSDDARDAAAWIAAQALIALENARLHGQVQRQAVTDELTGLSNRRRFLSQLESEVARSRRSGSPLGIVLADLDDFKKVNDTYGHDVGDEALRRFGEILQETVRDVDLPVRLGGEEFAVLVPDTGLAGAAQLAERLRKALEEATVGEHQPRIRLTASFGVSSFPEAAAAEDLLTDADRRLYDAKRRGKNQVVASKEMGSFRRS